MKNYIKTCFAILLTGIISVTAISAAPFVGNSAAADGARVGSVDMNSTFETTNRAGDGNVNRTTANDINGDAYQHNRTAADRADDGIVNGSISHTNAQTPAVTARSTAASESAVSNSHMNVMTVIVAVAIAVAVVILIVALLPIRRRDNF